MYQEPIFNELFAKSLKERQLNKLYGFPVCVVEAEDHYEYWFDISKNDVLAIWPTVEGANMFTKQGLIAFTELEGFEGADCEDAEIYGHDCKITNDYDNDKFIITVYINKADIEERGVKIFTDAVIVGDLVFTHDDDTKFDYYDTEIDDD
jgi:hypothetical protein